ncbi:MAG: hypothetical protein RBS80_30565 [Thermoguttaceae bacterium]|jgi:hypothetical protein|nr:hypothetical protein [Thermoguttaceae bacterium]
MSRTPFARSDRPSGISRATRPRFAARPSGKGAVMRKLDEGPRSGPTLWILAALAVVVAAKADTVTANAVTLAIAGWAMTYIGGRS